MKLPQKVFDKFLSEDPNLRECFRTFLENAVGRFDCSKSDQMTNILDVISAQVAEDDSNTVKSIFFDPEVRNKRSFHDERLTQVLHQLCCQVFYYFRYKGSVRIEEVQSLSVFDSVGSLQFVFFAVNPIQKQSLFSDLEKLWKTDFEVIITTPYSAENMNPSEKKRSLRHANKLKDRIYSPLCNTATEWRKIGDISRFVNRHGKDLKVHNSVNSFPDKQGIFLLNPLQTNHGKSLHAEQQLCDLLNVNPVEVKNCMLQITGKKRPCVGCVGRMIYENQKCKLFYNERPGFLWKSHFKKQDVEVKKKTLEVYVTRSSNISINHEGYNDRSVATESESSYESVEHTIPEIENAESLQEITADVSVTENVHNHPIEETIVTTAAKESDGEVLNDKEGVKQEKFQGDFDNSIDADISNE